MEYRIEPNYNPLVRMERWDEKTRQVIKKRISGETGEDLAYHFLTPREGEILELLVDVLIPQKRDANYVKISEIIDHDLKRNLKKVRYHDDPWPRDFYRDGLEKFASLAEETKGKSIEDFNPKQLAEYIEEIFSGDQNEFIHKFLRKAVSDAAAAFCSHPSAWSKIGFPGPAYPEGYAYLECGKSFDWEPKYEKKSSKN